MAERSDWLRLGVLTAPWGVHGAIKVHLDADPAYARRVRRVYLGAAYQPHNLLALRQHGRAWSLTLDGVDSVSTAEKLRGLEIFVARAEAPPLPEGHFFVQDVLGLRVRTTAGRDLGTVVEVLVTGANDVYVARGAAGEVLIPAIRDVVLSIDPAAGEIVIEPMPGLIE